MLNWFTATATGKFVATLLISMLPVIELRGGLPYGIALGLPYSSALIAAIIGNMIPVPFIILFIRKIFAVMRKWSSRFDALVSKLEEKGRSKSKVIAKYGPIGLVVLVAIPLPGTGAWTGALAATLLDIRLKNALPSILLGVLIAAAIISGVTYGMLGIL